MPSDTEKRPPRGSRLHDRDQQHPEPTQPDHATKRPQAARDGDGRPSPGAPDPSAKPSASDENPPLPDEPEPEVGSAQGSSSSSVARAETAADGAPPLPDEEPPEDDGWEALWDATHQAYYFFNRFTKVTQWENPRVPETTGAVTASSATATDDAAAATLGIGAYDRKEKGTTEALTGVGKADSTASSAATTTTTTTTTTQQQQQQQQKQQQQQRPHGGYNPAIHGDYDPNADYAREAAAVEEAAEREQQEQAAAAAADIAAQYVSSGSFNRFTGRWQNTTVMNPDRFNDENKSKRQMSAFFDVDAAANAHDGRSLKAERQGKRLTKKEVQAFRDKRRERKEEKRRAWLRD